MQQTDYLFIYFVGFFHRIRLKSHPTDGIPFHLHLRLNEAK